jgi:hypothetical protein
MGTWSSVRIREFGVKKMQDLSTIAHVVTHQVRMKQFPQLGLVGCRNCYQFAKSFGRIDAAPNEPDQRFRFDSWPVRNKPRAAPATRYLCRFQVLDMRAHFTPEKSPV